MFAEPRGKIESLKVNCFLAKNDEDDFHFDSIKIAVAELVDAGTHLDASKAASFVVKKLGLNERFVNYAHIEIRNKLNELKFKKTPYKERIIFLPHCLRHSTDCKAKHGDNGLECIKCGKCKICKLKEIAEKYGYKGAFIAPGGSMAYKIMLDTKPRAVLGIACYYELMMGMDKAGELGIPSQGVMLARSGCKDTDVNLEEAEEKIAMIEK